MTPHDVLRKYFGYDDFRPQQFDIIENALAGRDVFVLMPTGSGKSNAVAIIVYEAWRQLGFEIKS